MRNDNKKTVLVGVFVLIGIAILVTGILTLGGQQKRFVKTTSLKAVFDDVAGLQTGNNVWFSGVKIGTVRKINFYGDSQVEIEMNVEDKSKEYIRKDSKATISSDGLIGNKIIVIYGGTTQVPMVEDGDRLISEMPLDTDKMMETLQENNKNLVSITNDLKILTGKIAEGEGVIGAVLTDSTLAENFRNILLNLESTSVKSNRMVAELGEFSANLNKEGTLFNDLATDTELYNKLQSSVTDLQATADNAKKMTDNLNMVTNKLNSTDNAIGTMLNDPEFNKTLKSTFVNLDSSTMNLNRGLEALEYTWPFRKGFKRMNKAEDN
ncbi:ABC-type transport system involved in resistance to organic solvents, periplasmic component [Belliella baltica DSM 15883]|uniref:ABC-type transport system involved in resistance to organic solvents, periplasmic component n=1 Tax=Belliella baltica (strain DSM 15883 / CIP 108006 / LMG 21964 / BA134) TaxID=866536 RepID=I3Z6P5_BELBD|nr:MlaD family protein [Belliella baltica]AFL84913.1 ABC-type transport system involved in resistance to organic solvents, periplasmic component [Belliella baltica DSM 15883]